MIRFIDRFMMTVLVLLSAALLVLWFRSHVSADRYRWVQIEELDSGGVDIRSGMIWTGEGGIGYATVRFSTAEAQSARQLKARTQRRLHFDPRGYQRIQDPQYPLRAGASNHILNPLGINYVVETRELGSVRRDSVQLALPLWMVILAISGLPLMRFIRGVIERERAELMRLGLCPRCGVSLKQLPPRCPGCGKRTASILPKPTIA